MAVAAMTTAMAATETRTATVAAMATAMAAVKKIRLKYYSLHRCHPTKINYSAQPPPAPPIIHLFCCCRGCLLYHCRARTQWRVVGASSCLTNHYLVFTLDKIVLVHYPTCKQTTIIVPTCFFIVRHYPTFKPATTILSHCVSTYFTANIFCLSPGSFDK